MKSGIYCIKNSVTGNIYIGSTVNFKKREREHLCNLRKNQHHCIHLQRSWNKHGSEQFEFIIIETVVPDQLLIREQFYFDLFNPKYNILRVAGNSTGRQISEETRLKLSRSHIGQKAWNKGIPATDTQKQAQSKAMTGRISGAKGKKWSEQSRKNMSTVRTGIKSKRKIPIQQFNLDGTFVADHDSVTDAVKLTKIQTISLCISGRYKKAGGFIWKKKPKEETPSESLQIPKTPMAKD